MITEYNDFDEVSMEEVRNICGYDLQDDCIILEPQEVFNHAIVGYDSNENRLVYSIDLLIQSMIDHWALSYYDAIDHISYNTIGMLPNFDNPPLLRYDDE